MPMAWRYAAASVVGTSHHATGIPCQDAHLCESFPDDAGNSMIALIASDGAGSAKYGEIGARIATRTMLEQVKAWASGGGIIRDLSSGIAHGWLDGVRETIAEEAGASQATLRDYAATLLFALIDEDNSAFGQVGDGAIVTSSAVGAWDRQFRPKRGMYAPTKWDWSFFVGTLGLFFSLMFLFIRFLPVISIFEMRTIATGDDAVSADTRDMEGRA